MTISLAENLSSRLQDLEYRQEYGAAKIKSELALLLAEIRRGKELTQKELASLVGVSQAYIAKLESGDANPTLERVGSLLATIWVKLTFTPKPLGVTWSEPSATGIRVPSRYEDAVISGLRITESGSTGTAEDSRILAFTR